MTNKEKNRIQKEILDQLDYKPHGRLLLAPRVGKTKLIIDLIKRDKPESILWVTPSAKLAEQDIPDEFIKWKAKRYLKKLTTVTWMSLHNMTGKYDMIVLDEEQFITDRNSNNLRTDDLQYNYIIAMTGTATKHDDKLWLYQRLNLKVLIDLSINDAVDIGLLSNYTINVVNVEMTNKRVIEAGNKNKRFMTSEIANYNYLTETLNKAILQNRKDIKFRILNRMRAVKNSPSKLEAAKLLINKLKGRKLIFSASIKQAEELCSNRYHSKTDNKDLKLFLNGNIDCISMVNAGGTGFTYKNIDHLIITQVDSDKNGLTSQKISRSLLQQKDYHATIWILNLVGTQDTKWVNSTLQNFDMSKVNYLTIDEVNKVLN